jgi:hypothetical protein
MRGFSDFRGLFEAWSATLSGLGVEAQLFGFFNLFVGVLTLVALMAYTYQSRKKVKAMESTLAYEREKNSRIGDIRVLFFKPEVSKLVGNQSLIEMKFVNKGKLVNLTQANVSIKMDESDQGLTVKKSVFQIYSELPEAKKKVFVKGGTFDHSDEGRLNVEVGISKGDLDRLIRKGDREESVGAIQVELSYTDFIGNEKKVEYESRIVGRVGFQQLVPRKIS